MESRGRERETKIPTFASSIRHGVKDKQVIQYRHVPFAYVKYLNR